MGTYSRSKDYIKIYEEHYGSIPYDIFGRKYEIHHINGNHSDNNPTNLKAVTIDEHYSIHKQQGDYVACSLMAFRMNLTPEELSDIRSKAAVERVVKGTHPWQDREKMRKQNQKRTAEGKNVFSNPDIVKRQFEQFQHATQKRISCLGCRKETFVAMFNKWHTKCSA
jgi:hypothetical protein